MRQIFILLAASFALSSSLHAQTDHDAIMMNKKQWCNGILYEHSQWKNYWEGTLKRDNENIGTFTSQSAMFMSNYGITDRLNVMATVPYFWNHVSAGTLHKMSGFQDASLSVKYKAVSIKQGKSKIGLFGVIGGSVPLSNYDVDFMPLAIGTHASALMGRAIADYQYNKFFATASAAYWLRSNTSIDRNAYYTDHEIFSNKVDMPDAFNAMFSAGLRSHYLIAEAMVSNTVTQKGGFDIRRNDMPFASNTMNMTTVGAHVKYTLPFYTHVEITTDGSYVVRGRNAGQATSFGIGAYYLFTFGKKTTTPATHN